ncbi:MAG: efflux RND transporter periplasmic adaptor subunit, partial [Gemmatimonadota bacterium]|nr:efflux RND transporter periplasmic adaptor subunit [Gemmatimonadota bacterium]
MTANRWAGFAAAAVLLAGGACRRTSDNATEAEPRIEGDQLVMPPGSPRLAGVVTEAATVGAPDSLTVPGRLAWDEDATVRVFAPFAGRVTSVVADVGHRVRAGDTLALISSPDFGQAQADARRAVTDFALAERTSARTH